LFLSSTFKRACVYGASSNFSSIFCLKCVTYYIQFLKVNSYIGALAYSDNAMQDPCRPGVRGAVEICQKAGIKVFFLCAKFFSCM
jgi:hypothetical protein